MLAAIVTGDERATRRVALLVAGALDQWAARCGAHADTIRTAVKKHTTKEEGV